MNELIKILMDRDELSFEDANALVMEARLRVLQGEDPEEILYEDFGLEPDYVFDLIPFDWNS